MFNEHDRRKGYQSTIERFDACYPVLDIRYDSFEPDNIWIDGVLYSVGVFQAFGAGPTGMKDGDLFVINRGDRASVELTRVGQEGVLEEARRLFNKEAFDAAVRVEMARFRSLTAWQRFKLRWSSTTPRK